MGNKDNRKRKSTKRARKNKAVHMHEGKRARRLQQGADQKPTEQSEEAAPAQSYREWVAATATAGSVQLDTGPARFSSQLKQILTSEPTTSSAADVHTMSFRDWVAAQTAKKSREQTNEPTKPGESAETLSIYLPEPEDSDVVVKEEYEVTSGDRDVLDSSTAEQPMDTLIVDFGDTSFEQENMNTSTETDDVTEKKTKLTSKTEKKIKLTPNTEKRTSQRKLRERKSLMTRKPEPSKKKSQLKRKSELEHEAVRKPRRRKIIKHDASTTTEGLVVLRSEETSTEDLVIERSASEELKLLFELCDKYLDESATAAIRLSVTSRMESQQ